ncbi:MAG: Lon protease-like protein [Mariniblastus sp.]|jgi:Lon protease-like protein
MTSNQPERSLPDGFANMVRLFPLPNVVLFPGVVQALHLFEPRYCALVEDALAADELITMAYIEPGQLSNNDAPKVSQTVCIGKILSHTKLEDGRYNLFLVGSKRAEIITEIDSETPYRMAEVSVLEDTLNPLINLDDMRGDIITQFRTLAAHKPSWNHEALDLFLDDDLPFSQLVDMICYSCGASPQEQQRVLETIELGNRGLAVIQLMDSQIASLQQDQGAALDFPPGFSLN